MLHAAIQVLVYALLAGLSPVAFAATMTAMPAGRLKTVVFGTAFVLAQLFTCSVFVVLGVAAIGSDGTSHPRLHAGLELTLATALSWLAIQVRRKAGAPREQRSVRTQELLERLGRLRVLTTLLAGVLLGIGGPKRLVITALAASTITTAGLDDSRQALLVVVYVAIASVLVWAPTILFVFFGNRAVASMKRAQTAVSRRQPNVTVYALLLVAAFLTIDAIGVLAS